jgi:hypothetical protein
MKTVASRQWHCWICNGSFLDIIGHLVNFHHLEPTMLVREENDINDLSDDLQKVSECRRAQKNANSKI